MNEQIAASRRYDLDWLRVIAILLLLFYHAGMIFSTWEWHIKNTETSKLFNFWMMPLHNIRMPLLLFISGAGTYMALGKRTVWKYVQERFKRLVIPFVFGMFVLVPPMVYYEYIQQFNNYWDVYESLFDFIPTHNGIPGWYHFWFIAHLFVYSLIGIPILIFLRSPRAGRFKAKWLGVLLNPYGILILPAAIVLLSQLLLRPDFTGPFFGSAYLTFYMWFFLFGIICYSASNIRDAVTKNRKYFLAASIFIFMLRLVGAILKHNNIVDIATFEFALEVLSVLTSWVWVIAIIAYGQYYLNRPNVMLSKLSEGAYPFYMIHQPFIFAYGYYICQLSWGIGAKFWAISFLSLISIVSVYLLCIRPFNLMRFLFGMKLKPKV